MKTANIRNNSVPDNKATTISFEVNRYNLQRYQMPFILAVLIKTYSIKAIEDYIKYIMN